MYDTVRQQLGQFQMAPVEEGGGWAGQKIGNDVFPTGQIKHLQIEFRDESQMALQWQQKGGRNARQSSHKQFVICPQLESATFTKMAKMPDCCMCNQQFIKCGVTRLRVSQLSGKETKWPPIVPWFLLHDIADMSIGGVSDKRKLSLWGGMLEGYRCSQEAFCILESLLCRGGPLQCFGLPLQEISQQVQHLCTIGQKPAVKIHHAENMLQLLNVLG